MRGGALKLTAIMVVGTKLQTTTAADFFIEFLFWSPYSSLRPKIETGSTLLQSTASCDCQSCLLVIGHQRKHELHNLVSHMVIGHQQRHSDLHNSTSHHGPLCYLHEFPRHITLSIFDAAPEGFGVTK